MFEQLLGTQSKNNGATGDIYPIVRYDPTSNDINFPNGIYISSDGQRIATNNPYVSGIEPGFFIHDFDPVQNKLVKVTHNPVTTYARNQNFGMNLALSDSGTRLAMGADFNDAQKGILDIWEEDALLRTWSRVAAIKSPAGSASMWFGNNSVFLPDGDNLIVSSPGERSKFGNLYHFRRMPTGQWTSVEMLDVSNITTTDGYLGRVMRVSGDGTTLIASLRPAKTVHVWKHDGFSWVYKTAIPVPPDLKSVADDNWGASMAINHDGSVIVIGGPNGDSRPNGGKGFVVVYKFGDELYERTDQLVATNGSVACTEIGINISMNTLDNYILVAGTTTSGVIPASQGTVSRLDLDGDGKLKFKWAKYQSQSPSLNGVVCARNARNWAVSSRASGDKGIVYGR